MSNEITTQTTATLPSEEAPTTAQEARQKRITASQALLKKLAEAYPAIFPLPKDGRPVALAIGIHKQLIPVVTEWGFSAVNLRSALAWYTKQLRYQQAVLHASHRINLDGSEAEAIDDAHKALAKENVDKIQAYLAKKNPERAKKRTEKRKAAPKARKPRAAKTDSIPQKAANTHQTSEPRSLDEKMQSLLNKFNQ